MAGRGVNRVDSPSIVLEGGFEPPLLFEWHSVAGSSDTEVLGGKAEKLAERPDVGRLESFAACQSAEPKVRQIDLCSELVLDLFHEFSECRAVPSEK